MHESCWWILVGNLRHFQRRVNFSQSTAFRKWNNNTFTSNSELKSWNRLLLFQRNSCEYLVNAYNYLRALSKKVIFSESTAFRKSSNTPFTPHSELKCWNRLLLSRETHVSCWWMLVSSLRHFQRKMIFSESTAFRKLINTPFTSHTEVKGWNRLLLFQRNACEFLVIACK